MIPEREYHRAGWYLVRELLLSRDSQELGFIRLCDHPRFEGLFSAILDSVPEDVGPDPRFLGLAQVIDFCPLFREELHPVRSAAAGVIDDWNALCREAELVAVQLELRCSEWVARAYMREYELAEPKSFGSLSLLTGLLAQPKCEANRILEREKESLANLLRRSLTDTRNGDERHCYELFALAQKSAGRGAIQSRHLLAVMAKVPGSAAHRWLQEAGFNLEVLSQPLHQTFPEPLLPVYPVFKECYNLGPRTPGSLANDFWTWRDVYEEKGWSLWRQWNKGDYRESFDWLDRHMGRLWSSREVPQVGFDNSAFEFLDLALFLKSPRPKSRSREKLSDRIRAVEQGWWDWVRRESETLSRSPDGRTFQPNGLLSPTLMLACSEHADGQSLPLFRSLLQFPDGAAFQLLVESGLDAARLRKRLEGLSPPEEDATTLGHRLRRP